MDEAARTAWVELAGLREAAPVPPPKGQKPSAEQITAMRSAKQLEVELKARVGGEVWAAVTAYSKALTAQQQRKPHKPSSSADEGQTLEEALRAGQGFVTFCRPANDQDRECRTLLWVTPGVRGVWVNESDGVPSGEVVELMSTPQLSEQEDEGLFVRVRRQNGHDGWTKLKNIGGVAPPPPRRDGAAQR